MSEDGEEIDIEKNFGEGKFYSGGLTCTYNGKTNDCLLYIIESGGITGDILVDIMTYFNQIDLFPCVEGGPIPVLIVYGHQSCLDPTFVDYINNKRHPWNALVFHMPQHCGRLVMHLNRME